MAGLCLGLTSAMSVPSRAEEDSAERILIPAEKFTADKPAENTLGDEEIETNRRFNFEGFRSKVLGLWFKRKAFLQKNLPEAAAEQTQAIQHLCEDVGVTRLDEIASALVHEGNGFLEEGSFDKARRSFEDAMKFGPDLPEAHFGMATALWRGGGQMPAAAREFIEGLRALFSNHSLSSAMLGNALIIAILASIATSVLFAIAMILRYQALLRHDVGEALITRNPGSFSKEGVSLVGWAVLLLPLLTWIAALWTPAYWLTITFRYQRAREKVISALLFVLLVLSVPAARSAEVLFGLAADPSARLMLASAAASYDPEQIVTLEQKAIVNPRDPAYPFLLGGVYARGHYFQEALTQFKKVIELDPRSHRAYNNLGNIYLRTGRPEDALKCYKNALGMKGNFLPAHYNSYLARKELLQLKEAEASLREGQSLDPRAFADLIEDARKRGAGEPVDAVITREEVYRRILGEESSGLGTVSTLASLPSIVAGSFLVASLVLLLVLGRRHAQRCAKCGESFCHRCKIGSQAPDYCTPCQHVAYARGLAPAVRKEKISQSERFRAAQVRLSRLASLIAPGMGRLLDGRTMTGILISGAWCGALLALALRPKLLQIPGAGGERPLFLVTVLLGVMASCAWLLGNIRAARRTGAAGGWQWR